MDDIDDRPDSGSRRLTDQRAAAMTISMIVDRGSFGAVFEKSGGSMTMER